jgi:hypothetical protein
MRRLLSVLTLLFITLQFTEGQGISYTNNIKPIFNTYGCTSCHGGSGNFFVTPYTSLFTTGDHKPVVVKGDTNSVLIKKIKGTAGFGDQMPQGGPVMAANDLKLIIQWIKNGAPENPTSIDLFDGRTLPQSFYLAQNYPNPFNPSTVITYSIPKSQYVTLKVYNVLGKEVATLVDEFKEPGTYTSQFSVLHSQLTSGVYFYSMRAGSFVETKKLILLK